MQVCTLEFKAKEYVSVHTKMLRDISFNHYTQDELMLSASMDKTVKLTSLQSNTVVQQ